MLSLVSNVEPGDVAKAPQSSARHHSWEAGASVQQDAKEDIRVTEQSFLLPLSGNSSG